MGDMLGLNGSLSQENMENFGFFSKQQMEETIAHQTGIIINLQRELLYFKNMKDIQDWKSGVSPRKKELKISHQTSSKPQFGEDTKSKDTKSYVVRNGFFRPFQSSVVNNFNTNEYKEHKEFVPLRIFVWRKFRDQF